MRIGLIVYHRLTKNAGGLVYGRELVESLRALGDEVEVVELAWRGYSAGVARNWSRELRERLDRGRFDLLLQDEFTHMSFFRLNRELGVPVVAIVHHLLCDEESPPGLRQLYAALEKRYLQSVRGCIFASAATATRVRELVPRPPPSIVAYPAGDRFEANITPAEIAARAHAPGALRLLYVGSIIPRKRLHVLLRALAGLPRGRWTLDIAGDEQEEARYAARVRRQADDAGLTDNVRFHGAISDDELAGLYRRSQVVAMPSQLEGFGMAYLEGMSFGLPAIASNHGGAGELVKDGRNGFLVAPDDPAAIAARVSALLDDRDLLARCSLAALETYRRWPRWEETATRVRDFLLSVREGRPHEIDAD